MKTHLGRYPCGRYDETCRLARVRYDLKKVLTLCSRSAQKRNVFNNVLNNAIMVTRGRDRTCANVARKRIPPFCTFVFHHFKIPSPNYYCVVYMFTITRIHSIDIKSLFAL